MFANPELPVSSLPRVEQLHWQTLDRRFTRCLQTRALAVWVPLLAIAAVAHHLFASEAMDVRLYLASWVLLAAWALRDTLWPLISVPRRGYAVRELDIVHKSGVLWRSVKAVPYCRVQHVETSSGPVERRFGLAKLVVYTAGGAGGDLRIQGLAAETAQRLRVHVADRIGEPAATREEPGEQPDG